MYRIVLKTAPDQFRRTIAFEAMQRDIDDYSAWLNIGLVFQITHTSFHQLVANWVARVVQIWIKSI